MKKAFFFLLQSTRSYSKMLVVIAISGLLMSLATGQIAIFIKSLFDALEKRQIDAIWSVGMLIMGCALVAAISRYIHIYLMHFLADKITLNLRGQLQSKLLSMNLSFYANFKSGIAGLINRSLTDISSIQHNIILLANIIREPVLCIFLVTWLFILDWQLTLSLFALIPLVTLGLFILGKTLNKYNHQAQKQMDKLSSIIQESIQGTKVIQSFVAEGYMKTRFRQFAKSYMELRKKMHRRAEMASPITETMIIFLVVSIFIYMGTQITENATTLGSFTSYITSLMMLGKPVRVIQESYVKLQQCITSTERVLEVLNHDNEIKNAPDALPFPKDWKEIRYRGVYFSYHDLPAVKDLNLTLRRGQKVAFVGPSGCGKSTLIHLLLRFYQPFRGHITIDGIPLEKIDLDSLRKNISFVSQEVVLFQDTVANNISLEEYLSDSPSDSPSDSLSDSPSDKALEVPKPSRIQKSAQLACASDFIEQLPRQYDTVVGYQGYKLSGGERQRLSLARALYKEAPLWIMDEATSALDNVNEVKFYENIRAVGKDKTMLIVAHRFSTIAQCEKIVVLKKGRIVEEGSHESLIANPKGEYYHLYASHPHPHPHSNSDTDPHSDTEPHNHSNPKQKQPEEEPIL